MRDNDLGGTFNWERNSCKYCGVGNLKWKEIKDRWKLVDRTTGVVHVCKDQNKGVLIPEKHLKRE